MYGRCAIAMSFIPQLGQRPGSSRDDLGVHRARVGRGAAGGLVEVHLGDERQRLVRLGGQVAIEALTLGAELRVACAAARTPRPATASAGSSLTAIDASR